MATGTSAGLLEAPGPQSVYKHKLIEQYMIRFATMNSTYLTPRRSVLVDAFAGRGRHADGSAASAEHMMLASQKMKSTMEIDIYLVEKAKRDYQALDTVAAEYRARGTSVTTRHGTCVEHMLDIERMARGASLFLFLDPCGANLPWNILQPLLARRGPRPRTEALLNFSADLTRRAGDRIRAGQFDLPGVAKQDEVCGGQWWREVALAAYVDSGGENWESAADAVAHEYARRMGQQTGMFASVSAVRRDIHQQPVYHLIFLTHDRHGLWVMNDAAAQARRAWLTALGPDQDAQSDYLFPMDTVAEQIERERGEAKDAIRRNLLALLADGRERKVVEHTTDIFDGVYGIAAERDYTETVRWLVSEGSVHHVVKAGRPHKHVLAIGRSFS